MFYDAGLFGIMGLGSRLQDSLIGNPSSPEFQNPNASFPVIYDRLYQAGYIDKRLFSIWLNDEAATQGSILFGGIDHAKYHSTLQYVPLLLSGPGAAGFTSWSVNLTSVAIVNSQTKTPLLAGANSTISTVIDSGSPNMYLPIPLANAVAADMNATTVQGFPYVDCALHNSSKALEFGFDADGSHTGPRIRVPYGEIIYPFGDPANIGNVTAEDGTELCYLGLIGNGGPPRPIFLLGDTFIRSAYLVFDVDNLQVGMAPVRYR